MSEQPLVAFTAIVCLGIGAQWLAWRLHVPPVLLLLLAGLVAGPFTGTLDPDAVFGDLLLPFVSLAVGIILFEGGLTLNLAEIRKTGRVIRNLTSLGAAVTWVVVALAAIWILDMEPSLAALLGAILVVTGPTVIGPILRHVRPEKRVGSILRWEGILIDPVGAMLAVLTLEAIIAGEFGAATTVVITGVLKTAGIGLGVGLAGAAVMVVLLQRYLVPDGLHSSISLALVVGAFTAANELQHEAGLFAVTVMGIALASQNRVKVLHILEFKENLRVLLISGLFIVLAARLTIDDILDLKLDILAFLAVLVVIARPLAVALSTARSGLTWRERVFLSWMAPRGIVAAAVSSVFALRLAEEGHAGAESLVPVTFAVIVVTIALYGGTATWVARKLGIAKPEAQGVLIAGAHPWARTFAKTLEAKGVSVLLADTDWANISAARMAGLPTFYGSILSEHALDLIDLGGMGRLVAMTPSDEMNALAVQRFAPIFGRKEVYQLHPQNGTGRLAHALSSHFHGRLLFSPEANYTSIADQLDAGATLKTTRLTKEFDYNRFREVYGEGALPLAIVGESGTITFAASDARVAPKPGQTLIALVHIPANDGEPAET